MNPKTLKAAAERLAHARETLAAIEAKAAPLAAAASIRTNLSALQTAYSDALAAVALGEQPQSHADAALQALEAARKEADEAERENAALNAIREGLGRRLSAANSEAAEAADALDAAQTAWLRSELEAAEANYMEHAAPLVAAAHRMAAIKALLALRGEPLSNAYSINGALALPAMGPAGVDRYRAAHPTEHGIGADLTRVLAKPVNVAAELEALSQPGKPFAITRAARAVAGALSPAA